MLSPTAEPTTTKGVTVNLRASRDQRSLIDRAAETLGKSRTDFMLEAACREAEAVLLDQRYFALEPEAYAAFTAALDAPPDDNPRLRQLLGAEPPWREG